MALRRRESSVFVGWAEERGPPCCVVGLVPRPTLRLTQPRRGTLYQLLTCMSAFRRVVSGSRWACLDVGTPGDAPSRKHSNPTKLDESFQSTACVWPDFEAA